MDNQKWGVQWEMMQNHCVQQSFNSREFIVWPRIMWETEGQCYNVNADFQFSSAAFFIGHVTSPSSCAYCHHTYLPSLLSYGKLCFISTSIVFSIHSSSFLLHLFLLTLNASIGIIFPSLCKPPLPISSQRSSKCMTISWRYTLFDRFVV